MTRRPDPQQLPQEQISLWHAARECYFDEFKGMGPICLLFAAIMGVCVGACLIWIIRSWNQATNTEQAIMFWTTIMSAICAIITFAVYHRIDNKACKFAWRALDDGVREVADVKNLLKSVEHF